jgi:hypothetical protein
MWRVARSRVLPLFAVALGRADCLGSAVAEANVSPDPTDLITPFSLVDRHDQDLTSR